MGRYYSGDIEGKFWFGIQSSTDANFFGGSENEPNYLSYCFVKEDLPAINKGLKECLKKLGKYKKLIDDFFANNNSYNDNTMAKKLKISKTKLREFLEWYARYELGDKIYKCVKKSGECSFDAEL